MFNRHRMCSWTLAVAMSATMLFAGSVRASEPKDALKLVPEDAWGFVILRSLDTIDQRASHFQQLLNIPIPGQVTPFAMMPLGIMPGPENPIDMKSPVCVAMMDVQKFGAEDPSNAAVLIAPAKDPEALLKKFQAEEPTDGIHKCTVMQFPAYAAVRDGFVIVGKSQDCVTRVLKSKKGMDGTIAESRLKVLGESDIYVSASLSAVMGAYRELINSSLEGMAAVMGPQGGQLKLYQKMLEEISYFDVATTIDKDGVSLRLLIDAKKDSDFDKMVRAIKSSTGSLLKALPKEKFLFAVANCGGYNEHMEKFAESNPISSLVAAGGDSAMLDEKVAKALDEEVQKITKNTVSSAVSISALSGTSEGMFGLTIVVETKDSEQYMNSLRKCWEHVWKISSDEEFKKVQEFLTHKADAESVGDHKVDTITLNLKGVADEQEMDEDDVKSFERVLGKDLSLRFGAVDSTHVVMTFGGGKARHELACKASKADKGDSLASDKGISEVSEQLPSPRFVEGYFAIDNIMQVVKAVLKEVGEDDEEFPTAVTIDAPLAFSAQQSGSVMRGDLHIPTKLIVAVKKIYDDQAKAQAMSAFDEEDEDSEDDMDDMDEEEDTADDSDDEDE